MHRVSHIEIQNFRACQSVSLPLDDFTPLASEIHNQLKAHSIWVWKAGCIEHITGTANKGEDAIIEREEALRKMSAADVAAQMAALVECFDWIKAFEKSQPKAAEVVS